MLNGLLLKRVFDIIASLFGLIWLSPVMLFIICLIKFSRYSDAGAAIFKQQRVGQNQNIFYIHKFRTMVVNAAQLGGQISPTTDPRITKIGAILRKTKLDELPQLFDVLRGKMSLVGPRPEVPEYVAFYPDEAKKVIFSVKPGITDWASIMMIDEGDILANTNNPKLEYLEKILPQKIRFAIKYVNERNFIQDLKIILITLCKVFRR